jgi:hypothetical protein
LPLFTPPHAPFLTLIIHGWYNGKSTAQAPTNYLTPPIIATYNRKPKKTKIKTSLTGITEKEI